MKKHLWQSDYGYPSGWNKFLTESTNGSWLMSTDFLKTQQFSNEDQHIIFCDEKGIKLGMIFRDNGLYLESHPKSTFGGIIYRKGYPIEELISDFSDLRNYLTHLTSGKSIILRLVPPLFRNSRDESDLLALFRIGGRIFNQMLSTAIVPEASVPNKLRKRQIIKAKQSGYHLVTNPNLEDVYRLIVSNLKRHNVQPVHTFDHLSTLCDKFPENIAVHASMSAKGEISAAVVVFKFAECWHLQYIASDFYHRQYGALDILIDSIIGLMPKNMSLSLGASTENRGLLINAGLFNYKSSWGGYHFSSQDWCWCECQNFKLCQCFCADSDFSSL